MTRTEDVRGARRQTVPAPRYTLWAALLVALLLSGVWLAGLGIWSLLRAFGLG